MVPHDATPVLLALIDGILYAILLGALASWAWTTRQLLKGQALLPEAPIVERRRPPWGPGTILLVLLAYILVSREAFHHYAEAARPPALPADRVEVPVQPEKNAPDPAPAKAAPGHPEGPARKPAGPGVEDPFGLSTVELMAIQGAINGLFLLMIPILARLTSGTRLRDLGLTLRNVRRQVAAGLVAVLFLMPIVYSVQAACIHFFDLSPPEQEKFKHPLEKMLRDSFSPGVAALALLTAVVLAPAFEELLFRGLLQGWLTKFFDWLSSRSPTPAKPGPVVGTAPSAVGEPDALFDPDLDRALLVPAPGYWEPMDEPGPAKAVDVPDRPRWISPAGAAIFLTSLLFAGLHAGQWPAPIPLFLLAIGLGVVYQRTGSLLAPICMHAVFNGFSTLILFHVALQPPPPDKPAPRPVLERVAPADKAEVADPAVKPQPPEVKK